MINILYAGNEKIFNGLLCSVTSIANKTSEPLHIYVLSMDLTHIDKRFTCITQEEIDFIQKVLQKKNPESKATLLDVTDLYLKVFANNKNENTQYTPYTLLRLLGDYLDLPEKILYLDIDIMATKDIKELFDTDITDYEYGAVKDYLGKVFIKYNYCNAGVLLLNIKKIKETKLFEKARHLIMTKHMFLADQSAINNSTTKKLILPRKFNEQHDTRKDTVIRHFCKTWKLFPVPHTRNVKQWDIYGVHKRLKYKQFDADLEDYIYYKKCFENKLENF